MHNMERPLGHWDSLCMDRRLGDHFHYCSRREMEPRLHGRCNTLDYCLWRPGEPRTLPLGTRFVNTNFPLENWLIRRALVSEIKWPGEPIKRERAPPPENEEPANNESSANNVMAHGLPVIACFKSPEPRVFLEENAEVNNAAASADEIRAEICGSMRSYSDYDLVSTQKRDMEENDCVKEQAETTGAEYSPRGFSDGKEFETSTIEREINDPEGVIVAGPACSVGDVHGLLDDNKQIQGKLNLSASGRRRGGLTKFLKKLSARLRLTTQRSL